MSELLKKWEKRREELINPDGFTEWCELGISEDSPEAEGFTSVTKWLRDIGEFDEGEQAELALIEEFISDLKGRCDG